MGNSLNKNQRPLLKNQSGSVSIEFLLLMPTVALIIMFLLGMFILQKKHQALVASRFATQYQTVYLDSPSSAVLGKAVNDPRGNWELNADPSDADADSQAEMKGKVQQGDGLGFAGVFDSILNFLGGNNRIEYQASSRTFRGIIPRMRQIDKVEAKYVVEANTWTCKANNGNNRGSYLSMIINQVPFIGEHISNFLNLSCCKTYQATKDENVR